MKDQVIEKPKPVQTPYTEMQVLAELYDTAYFDVLKRLARRLTDSLRQQAFSLSGDQPGFEIKHTRYKEQAMGVIRFLELIKQAKQEFEKLNE